LVVVGHGVVVPVVSVSVGWGRGVEDEESWAGSDAIVMMVEVLFRSDSETGCWSLMVSQSICLSKKQKIWRIYGGSTSVLGLLKLN
jgi:hypothetical protein